MARIRLMDYLCILSFMQGDIATTQTWAERVRQLAQEHELAESLCFARHYLGVVHYLRHEFDAAESFLRPLVEEPAGAAQSHMTMGAFALVLIHDSRGEFLRGNALMDRLVAGFQDAGDTFALAIIDAFNVELALRRGDAGAARRKRSGVDFALRPPLWFFYISQLTPIKLLLLEGTPEALGAALVALDEFDARMSVLHRNLARIDGLALSALVCDKLGDGAAAFAHLTTALGLACDAGVIRPFVDLGTPMARLLQRLCDSGRGDVQALDTFITQILGAFPVPAPLPAEQGASDLHEDHDLLEPDTLPEPLTEREVQVLEQLAAHLTPAEIAARYVVSVLTVRSQIKSIYRKLDVHNRKEAIRRSRALKII